MEREDLLTLEESAEVLRIPVDTVERLVGFGKMEARLVDGRWLVPRGVVESLLPQEAA